MIVHILVAWTCLSVLVAALWALHAHRETQGSKQRRDRAERWAEIRSQSDRAADEFSDIHHCTGRHKP